MSIKHITTENLRHMGNAEEGILRNGSKFSECSSFEHDGLTCLLFPFKGVDADIGRLAIWRLKTHDAFGGTWLSDYVPNRLGGFENSPLEESAETEEMDGGMSMK